MSKIFNKVLLIGTIESQPVLRFTNNNTPVTNFTLTTVNTWTNKSGNNQTQKKWHHIVCWGKLAENVVENFKIGCDVVVEGSISYRQREKNDQTITVAEIKAVFVTPWAGSLNKVFLVGFVDDTPQLRKTTSKTSVTNFSLTTLDTWQDQNGKSKLIPKHHKTVCWGKTAELVSNSVEQDDCILVEGSVSYKTVVNDEGVKNNHIAEIKISQMSVIADSDTNTISKESVLKE
jgi:single-strand DNA-binding protein